MMYVVYYLDDHYQKHMTFVKSYKEVEFLRERFGDVTVESYKVR